MKWLPLFALLIICLTSCSKDDSNQKTLFEIYNKGGDGNTSSHLLGRVDKDVVDLRPKLVIIMIGTNDVSRKVPFADYRSNLSIIINKIKAGGADVLVLSPPPKGKDVISYPTYYANDKVDTIAQIDSTLSKSLGCYYLNINKAFKDAGTPNPTATSMIFNEINNPDMADGTHPTAEGLLFIATKVYNFMKANMDISKYTRIVCFGDSITYGANDPRAYPAQLEILLNQ